MQAMNNKYLVLAYYKSFNLIHYKSPIGGFHNKIFDRKAFNTNFLAGIAQWGENDFLRSYSIVAKRMNRFS
jgi:hypothetical protein